jgi:hypothetical protein
MARILHIYDNLDIVTALERVLRRMNIIRDGNMHQFEELWSHLDKDRGGTISIQEFCSRCVQWYAVQLYAGLRLRSVCEAALQICAPYLDVRGIQCSSVTCT